MIGKSVAHYVIEEKIGQGGMGAVYRASDKKLGRPVALKVLPDLFAHDQERMARFQREAQVLASLNHPNVGAIYGLEEDKEGAALILELVEGPTLEDRIDQGALPLDEALRIAQQIAQALEAAHERGIIHRDLKPSNVKLTSEGEVKVLDFGLAKAIEGEAAQESGSSLILESPTITAAMTGPNVILGTAAYMSPEQARGKKVDQRTDVWAFGVILYEMLTGKRLFEGETISDTLAAVLKTDPEWSALPPDLPPRIHWLLRRCLERDPRERVRHIGDAKILIDEVRTGQGEDLLTVEPAAGAVTTGRQKVFVAGLGVAAILATVVAVLSFFNRPSAELAVRKYSIPLTRDDLSASWGSVPRISPDGERLAYLAHGKVWVRELDQLEPREVVGSLEPRGLAWSQDGQWLAVATRTGLYRVSQVGGEPTLVTPYPSNANYGTSGGVSMSSRDGIVFCQGDAGIYQVSPQGGDPKELLAPGEGESDFHDVSVIGDGLGWVFSVHHEGGGYNTLGILDSKGLRKNILTIEDNALSDPVYSPSGHILFSRAGASAGIWAFSFDVGSMERTGEPFIVAVGGMLPSVSSDGTLTYYSGTATSARQLNQVDRLGNVIRPIGDPEPYFPHPSVSPDGTQLAIRIGTAEDRDLWILDLERDTKRRVTFTREPEYNVDWSTDSRVIYSYTRMAGYWKYWRANANGTGGVDSLGRGAMPHVSHDGQWIAFANDEEETGYDIFVRELDNPEEPARKLIGTDAEEWSPSFSPDGRYIAYSSSENGPYDVFITTFPDVRGKWQVSNGGGHWPVWNQDGTELFFVDEHNLLKVDVSSEGTLQLGRTEVLFERPESGLSLTWPDAFGVSPDGQSFYLVQKANALEEEDDDPAIVIVQNWAAEFEKR